jgi:hypothetical protein
MRFRPAGRFAFPSALMAATRGAAAGMVLALAACAGPAKTRVREAAAVTLENHSDYAWRVEFFARAEVKADATARVDLGPRESRRLDLAPGSYRVRSQATGPDAAAGLKADPAPDAEVELRAGRTYVWPLGTLLSAESPGP